MRWRRVLTVAAGDDNVLRTPSMAVRPRSSDFCCGHSPGTVLCIRPWWKPNVCLRWSLGICFLHMFMTACAEGSDAGIETIARTCGFFIHLRPARLANIDGGRSPGISLALSSLYFVSFSSSVLYGFACVAISLLIDGRVTAQVLGSAACRPHALCF